MDLMTPIAIRGIVLGVLIALVGWLVSGWLYALPAELAMALVTAFMAVGRCELR